MAGARVRSGRFGDNLASIGDDPDGGVFVAEPGSLGIMARGRLGPAAQFDGFDDGRGGLRNGHRLSSGGCSLDFVLAWLPDAGAAAPDGGFCRVELGGGSAGDGSGPRRPVLSVASCRQARGPGGLRAGWRWWFGWPFGASGWFATHRRAKALFRKPLGTEDDDVPRRRVLLKGVFVAELLLHRLGSSEGNPRSRA